MRSATNHVSPLYPRSIDADKRAGSDQSGDFWLAARRAMIRSVSSSGFVVDTVEGYAEGDAIALILPGGEAIEARVVETTKGVLQCAFSHPLGLTQLRAARSGGRIAWRDEPAPAASRPGHLHAGERWPLPARAAIAVGGASALWGLILLALR